MNVNDVIRMRHMLDAAKEAIYFVEGESHMSLVNDRKLTFAVVRALEIIGEAASRTTIECQNATPQIPWRGMIGMRNRLIHAYFEVDYDQVWNAVTDGAASINCDVGAVALT